MVTLNMNLGKSSERAMAVRYLAEVEAVQQSEPLY